MTLNTGAERSGKTSWGRSRNHSAPTAAPASTRKKTIPGFENNLVRIWFSICASIVLFAFASGLLRFGFQQERPFHHHGFPGLQPLDDLDLAFHVAPSFHGPHFEDALRAGHKDEPLFVHALD